MKRLSIVRHGAIASLLILLLAFTVDVLASPSNKWRIQISGHARVDGQIELSFTPRGGEARSVVIPVPRHTGENRAAALIRDRIRSEFGADVYHAEVDDGEDVLVKSHGSTPAFELIVVRNTADGLRLGLDRE